MHAKSRSWSSIWLVLRSLFWTIVFPGFVAWYVPWRFFGLEGAQFDASSPRHVLAAVLIGSGVVLLGTCIYEFARGGRGTLSPLDPPRHLVVRGLYRHVRNPMYLGVLTIMLGEVLVSASIELAFYCAIWFLWVNLFVMAYEEPALRRRFGSEYDEYRQRVGRWIPHGARTRGMAPMTSGWSVRVLHAIDDRTIDALADVLMDCVEGGASVGFMFPMTRERTVAFWRTVAQAADSGERAVLIAEDGQGVCGTVQLVLAQPENQPHRAEVAKMLVHRRARRQGVGAALMRAAEATARECGKTLLVLDAVTGGDAARLYERLGWQRVGDIPGYALWPRGGLCSTTYYYRNLGSSSG